MIANKDFSYETYRHMLYSFQDDGRIAMTFGQDLKGLSNYFLVRHDIDYSLQAALDMARVEADLGINATYFVLLTSEWYNALDADSIEAIRELAGLGHEIGLHYDMAIIERLGRDPFRSLEKQADLLADVSGENIVSIAMHNPSISGEDPFREFEKYNNAYHSRFVEEISYFSDSAGAWRDNFAELLENGKFPDRFQILVHPLFWRETHHNRWDALDRVAENARKRIGKLSHEAQSLWRNHAGVKAHDARNKV